MNSTLRYYDDHAEEFCVSTFSLDLGDLYIPFLERLPNKGRILDAGCGSGRDAFAFSKLGFEVEAFDASPKIVRIAQRKTGLPIRVDTFETFQPEAQFDGIWACASLLHLAKDQLAPCLKQLAQFLNPTGVIYASFKRGDGCSNRGERKFLDLLPEQVPDFLHEVGTLECLKIWETADLRTGREKEQWVNLLL